MFHIRTAHDRVRFVCKCRYLKVPNEPAHSPFVVYCTLCAHRQHTSSSYARCLYDGAETKSRCHECRCLGECAKHLTNLTYSHQWLGKQLKFGGLTAMFLLCGFLACIYILLRNYQCVLLCSLTSGNMQLSSKVSRCKQH